ncbi:hypothetical protein [Streptomyces sp. NPDC002176]|uniref:hypothetical protein n=1 Tax=Streptomyces sp. NPDC002176 TaxID=3364634 RepID=UPI00384D11AA
MSARNRHLPRDRAWPLTMTDITGHLGPLMADITDVRFLTGRDSGDHRPRRGLGGPPLLQLRVDQTS